MTKQNYAICWEGTVLGITTDPSSVERIDSPHSKYTRSINSDDVKLIESALSKGKSVCLSCGGLEIRNRIPSPLDKL